MTRTMDTTMDIMNLPTEFSRLDAKLDRFSKKVCIELEVLNFDDAGQCVP